MNDDDPTIGDRTGKRDDDRDRFRYDVDGERPSVAVIRAVASITGRSVLDIPPLYQAVDPEHLDSLFDGKPSAENSITFQYHGFEITVRQNRVIVEEITELDRSVSSGGQGQSPTDK